MPQAALQEVLAGPQSEIYGALPKVALPGDDELLLRFATELLAVLKDQGLYRRDNVVVYPYEQRQRLEMMEPKTFRSWVEHFCVCYKVKYDANGHPTNPLKTMPKEAAEGVLACVDFWQGLNEVQRCHPVPMPVINEAGELLLLGGTAVEGGDTVTYDPESKTLTFA